MKLHFSLLVILAISSTSVLGLEDYATKCACHADNFDAKLWDERRCLETASANGLENCLETAWDSTFGLQCTKCAPTHAINEAKTCIPHELPNCIEGSIKASGSVFPDYAAGFKCTKCAEGYFVNGDDWCVEYPNNIPNCTVFEQHGSGANDTRCHTCQEGTWIQVNDKSACPGNPAAGSGEIANCTEYINANGTTEGWSCSKCASGTWKQDDENLFCTEAPAVGSGGIANCTTYINANGTAEGWSCSKCASGTWKQDDENLFCTEAPAVGSGGIANCANFTNANGTAEGWSCADCNPGKWKQDSDDLLCADTPAVGSGGIENCEKYINADGSAGGWTCHTCEDTYIKNTANKLCWATPINTTEPTTWTENCKTWTHPLAEYVCSACNVGYYIKVVGGKNKCLPVQRPYDHCITYTDEKTCSICEDRYWLEDSVCVKCPDEKYVAPVPVVCNSTTGTPGNPTNSSSPGNPTNSSSPGNPGNPGNPNGTTTNSIILQSALIMALSLVLL